MGKGEREGEFLEYFFSCNLKTFCTLLATRAFHPHFVRLGLNLANNITMSFRWFVVWAKRLAVSWLPFPKTVYIMLNSKARKSATYVVYCHGAFRIGLKYSFLPVRYDENSETISVRTQGRLISNLHFIMQMIWCLQQTMLGFHWYYTTSKDVSLDENKKRSLVWKKLVCFHYVCLASGSIPISWIVRKRADELKPLLTAPFYMEQRCVEEGATGYVEMPLLGLVAFALSNCFFMPLVYFSTSIFRPCLPFMLISQFDTNCPTHQELSD